MYITAEHSQPDSYAKFAKNTSQQIIQPYVAYHADADVHHQVAGNNQDAGEQIYSTQTNKSKTQGAAQYCDVYYVWFRVHVMQLAQLNCTAAQLTNSYKIEFLLHVMKM
jgi:hypothetical protein